jgi:hypothetical protein
MYSTLPHCLPLIASCIPIGFKYYHDPSYLKTYLCDNSQSLEPGVGRRAGSLLSASHKRAMAFLPGPENVMNFPS